MSGAAPVIAGEILLIPVDAIEIGERLRPIDAAWAEALGHVMAREGQQTPIEVCRLPGRDGWRLVAGAHRLTGARSAGMELIEAREVSNSAAFRRLREVGENLWRRDLDPIDRAAFIAELAALKKAERGLAPGTDGRAASAQARWQKAVKAEAEDTSVTLTVVYGWNDELAAELGISKSGIERDLTLYRRLAPGVIATLREARHPILKNAAQLRQLAKLEARDQAKAAAHLTGGRAANAGEAIALVKGKPKRLQDPAEKRLSTFLDTYSRMSLTEKKGALALLAEQLPAGFTLTEEKIHA